MSGADAAFDGGLDDDFAPVDPAAYALERLVRGIGRRDIAAELGVSLPVVNQHVAQAVRQRSGESGTAREVRTTIHAGLDDITRRAYLELERDRENVAPLLEVLLGVHRLRAGLIASATRQRSDDE